MLKRFMGYNDSIVTFRDESKNNIDLPDPEILALHAAFCGVFYASAAGEYFDTIHRDTGSLRVMSTDGSTDLYPISHLYLSLVLDEIRERKGNNATGERFVFVGAP
jgi:hypothetical protein